LNCCGDCGRAVKKCRDHGGWAPRKLPRPPPVCFLKRTGGFDLEGKPCSSKKPARGRWPLCCVHGGFAPFRAGAGRGYRYFRRSSSLTLLATSGSSTGKGRTSAWFNNSSTVAATFDFPRSRFFGLFVPAGRGPHRAGHQHHTFASQRGCLLETIPSINQTDQTRFESAPPDPGTSIKIRPAEVVAPGNGPSRSR